jgi:hypothetical protein
MGFWRRSFYEHIYYVHVPVIKFYNIQKKGKSKTEIQQVYRLQNVSIKMGQANNRRSQSCNKETFTRYYINGQMNYDKISQFGNNFYI